MKLLQARRQSCHQTKRIQALCRTENQVTCEYEGSDVGHFNDADCKTWASSLVQWEHPARSPSSTQHTSTARQRSVFSIPSDVSPSTISLSQRFACRASSMLFLMSSGRDCSTCVSTWHRQIDRRLLNGTWLTNEGNGSPICNVI